MFILGLTGPIASGKTTVAAFFENEGVPVLKSDETIHLLQGPQKPCSMHIANLFGQRALKLNGAVNREDVWEAIKQQPERLKQLEAILHPALYEHWQEEISMFYNRKTPLLVLDAPLLIDSIYPYDALMVCQCPSAQRQQRALERPGMTLEKWEFWQAHQPSETRYRDHADISLNTSGDVKETLAHVRTVIGDVLSGTLLKKGAVESWLPSDTSPS